jgi:hypothetical protein
MIPAFARTRVARAMARPRSSRFVAQTRFQLRSAAVAVLPDVVRRTMTVVIADTNSRDVALRLTAVVVLLRPMGAWYVRPAILGLAALALVSAGALRLSVVWLSLAGLIAVRIVADWPLADNHIYLLAYWCLAAAIALRAGEPVGSLGSSGRWLIGLSFACAVVWKALLSPDFLDSRFFRVTLLTDPRLTNAAQLVGGLSDKQIEADYEALEPLPQGAELAEPPIVVEPARLRVFARMSTWGVLMLEATVAALMLMPSVRFVAAARHATLLAFCLTTYAFAPVAGFGWLLLVMGAAQVQPHQTWLRRVYVGVFMVILAYAEVPWAGIVLDLSGS